MRAVVFATAGHIDHGKTTLIRALTGVDCDRLAEEKRRGITIVLGFAPMDDPSGEVELSFVDVPGHERLVHTMIAGAGGVDRALLVVAADEGVMPQTVEHLDILALLGVREGVVALTKIDLVDAETVAERESALRAALAGGPLRDAPVVPCSASTGAGIERLREEILACARGVRRRDERWRPFRLGVDRAFSVPGAGTVVTGTVRWGSVGIGDELVQLPAERAVRVRGLQVHGHPRETAAVGERCALRLAGVSVDEVPVGDQLLSAGPWSPTHRVLVELRTLPGSPGLGEGDELWLHLLASRRRARIERVAGGEISPGGSGRVVIRLARGVFAAPGDRVILRRYSPVGTVAGGTVIESDPPRLRRRDANALAARPDPSRDLVAALRAWISEAGLAGLPVPTLASRAGLEIAGLEAALGAVIAAGGTVVIAGTQPLVIERAAVDAAVDRAVALLEAAGQNGVSLAELSSRAVPHGDRRVREHVLGRLRSAGVLHERSGRALAARLAAVEDPLAARLVEAYGAAGLDAPSPEEMALRLGEKPKIVAGVVRALIDRGRLIRVGGKWVLAAELGDEIISSLREWGVETFDVGEFKARFGVTRKLAIPLLEWLDSSRVTRREGDRRRILARRSGSRSGG